MWRTSRRPADSGLLEGEVELLFLIEVEKEDGVEGPV